MVIFKAGHDHFSSAMCMINTFRKDASLCDVTLIVGKQSLQAHRCMLAAASPYFSSLFIGQFTEANMKEINLSEVTSSIPALEKILEFIYTGEIDIVEDNLEVIMKLSSFFLIESLNEFCCTFMTDNLSLTTCLRYYLDSIDHGLSVIEKQTWPMVQSRFHDHLIYEEDTLSLSTSQMQFLFEKNILQHCSNVSILRFIAMWVNKGLTERHVMIAKEIFDYVMKRDNSPKVCPLQVTTELSVDSLYELTESSLNDNDMEGKDLFLNSFKEVLGKLTTEHEMHTAQTISQARHNGKETAIIAVFPSNDVIEYNKKIRNTLYDRALTVDPMPTNCVILYVCAYIPRTRNWYSMKSINNDGGSFASLIDQNWLGKFDALHDDLLFINDDSYEITVNDLNNLDNLEINSLPYFQFLENEASHLPNDMNYDICLAAGGSNSRYLVSKFRRFENNEIERVLGIYFNGYTLHDGNTRAIMFKTELIPLPSSYERTWGGLTQLYAKISTVSNEMMVVHSGDELDVVFVVDLSADNVRPMIVLSSEIDNQKDILKGTHIIETNDAMYIVTDGTIDTGRDNGKVVVKYEYRLNSKQLTEINTTVVNVGQLQENTHGIASYPCLSESSASVGDGLWFIEGDNNASFLTKVTLDHDRNPIIEHHTPPPFHSITAMFASRISSQILENKEPVTRYLGNE